MRILTCIGDATSPAAWSGTPFHLFRAAQRAGFLDDAWTLDPRRYRLRRAIWNIWSQLRHGERGGFQYSADFLRRLLSQASTVESDAEVISHFPLFPPPNHAGPVSYYIDATLAQNFEEYGLADSRTVSRHMMADAMTREKAQYTAAKHIVCMSRWAARSVVERYQVDPTNVHVVPAGSNFVATNCSDLTEVKPASLSKLRLGFLGKDWKRKNLNFVLEIAECLHARGIEVEVAAAGFAESDGPRHNLLRSIGYIDKHGEPQRFLYFMRSCHFTCLFSSAEAFGISNRESLRLGIPVLASRTGGIPDTVPEGCGHLFDAQASADEIADVIASYADNPDSYAALCARIVERSATFTWESSVEKLAAIWNGSSDYSYERLNSADA